MVVGSNTNNGAVLDGIIVTVGCVRLTRDNNAIRAMVGVVFQDMAFGLLHMGLPKEDIVARVDSALNAVRMSGFRYCLSHHLSVEEKKRIAIATMFSMNPPPNSIRVHEEL